LVLERPGDVVLVGLIRDGQSLSVSLKIGEAPAQ
jgi:hypothetical protein